MKHTWFYTEKSPIGRIEIPRHLQLVFVCVGSDRRIFDSYAPLVGTMLRQVGVPNVHGTLDNPIHAMNLTKWMEILRQLYPNAYVIGVGSTLCDPEKAHQVSQLTFEDAPLQPGTSVALPRELPKVGNAKMTAVVGVDTYRNVLEDTRLHTIVSLAQASVNFLLEAIFDETLEARRHYY